MGVNKYVTDNPERVDVLMIDNTAVRISQIERINATKDGRDETAAQAALAAITSAAKSDGNLLAACVDAARAPATVGEMSDAMEEVFGRHAAQTRTISGVYSANYEGDEHFAAVLSQAMTSPLAPAAALESW